MTFAVTFTLINFVAICFWIASGKPLLLPPSKGSTQEHKNAFNKLMNALVNLQITEEQVFSRNEKPSTDHKVAPEIDEEKINEKTGIAKNPHMYGDILLTPEQEKVLNVGDGGVAQGIKQGAKLWPNGIVPYQFDFRLNSMARREIANAIQEFALKSCIRFVHRTWKNKMLYPNYVYFTPIDSGCFSRLGMIGGQQTINIDEGCEHKGVIQHEILHALGRVHEQNRPDRDNYVTIDYNNIEEEMEHNFKIIRADTSLPYDYGSVMHYGAYAFSSNGWATITPHQPARIGQREGLSTVDWMHLQKAYCQHDRD